MARKKVLITKKHRYFTSEEALCLMEHLKDRPGTFDLKAITTLAFAIEIREIEAKDKLELKTDLEEIIATIYKTRDSWKDLKERERDRELKNHRVLDFQKVQ